MTANIWEIYEGRAMNMGNPEGPRTQIMGLLRPNSIMLMIFGPSNPIRWVFGPSGCGLQSVSTLNLYRIAASPQWLWLGCSR